MFDGRFSCKIWRFLSADKTGQCFHDGRQILSADFIGRQNLPTLVIIWHLLESECEVTECCGVCQLKVAEADKSKVKQELDETNKQLTDKTAAETKAQQDLTKLTTEKVCTSNSNSRSSS